MDVQGDGIHSDVAAPGATPHVDSQLVLSSVWIEGCVRNGLLVTDAGERGPGQRSRHTVVAAGCVVRRCQQGVTLGSSSVFTELWVTRSRLEGNTVSRCMCVYVCMGVR